MRILGVGSSVEKVPGVPGWEQLICGSVIIKCHFLKQAAQDFLAGSLLQSRSKSTVQRIQNFHTEAKLLFCLHFFFNQAPLYLSVSVSAEKKQTICNLLIIALARKVSKSLSQRLKT